MEPLRIGVKIYTMTLGLDFIRILDRFFEKLGDQVGYGCGVAWTLFQLENKDPLAVERFILAATSTETDKPTKKEIELLFADADSKGKLDDLFDFFIKALSDCPLAKLQIQNFQKILSR